MLPRKYVSCPSTVKNSHPKFSNEDWFSHNEAQKKMEFYGIEQIDIQSLLLSGLLF